MGKPVAGEVVILPLPQTDLTPGKRRPALVVADLPGCMAHGKTRQEAVKMAEEAIELWIETAKEDGVAVPRPRSFAALA